jgi:hypothetical protein
VLLLLVFIRTRNAVPKQKELDLSSWAVHAMEPDEIPVEVPPEEVVHVDMKTEDVEFAFA